jgi:predicted PurR-regulated permease PerM
LKIRGKKNVEPSKQSPLPDRGQWVAIFFFICFGWIAYQTFRLAEPFLPGLLGAVILGLIFSPLYRRVLKRVGKPNNAAFILTAGIILLTVLPMVWTGWTAFKEAEFLRPTLAGFIDNYQTPSYVQGLLGPLFHFFEGFHIELKPLFLDEAAKIGARMSSGGDQLAGHLLILLFNGVVLMLTLFFVFRDGKKAAERLLEVIPMPPPDKQDLLKRVYGTFHAVVVGVFVTALVTGVADMLGFFAAGVSLPIFFGLAVAVVSLLGASVFITVPVAFWVMNHDTGWGIFLLVWGILVSVLSDNVLKPALMGSQARMPFLVMLFSTLGGLKLYGFMGLFLGPMVVTAFLAFWNIYRRDYKT